MNNLSYDEEQLFRHGEYFNERGEVVERSQEDQENLHAAVALTPLLLVLTFFLKLALLPLVRVTNDVVNKEVNSLDGE